MPKKPVQKQTSFSPSPPSTQPPLQPATQPSNKGKTCLKISAIGCAVLIVLCIAAVGFALIYRSAKKRTSLDSLMTGQSKTNKPAIVDSGKTDEEMAKELLASAGTYYNCKYRYTFKYPKDWTLSDMTHESDKVFIYGNGINISFTAHLNKGLTIDQWTNQKKNQYPGILKETRHTNRSDANGILLAYQDPDSLVFFWPEKNHIIEMYASGDNYKNDNPEAYVVGSTLQVNYTSAQCPDTDYQQPAQQQGGVDPNTCLHPNGDVEYWWHSATQAERDCYTVKYGTPSFLQQPQPTTPPQQTGGIDPNTCMHPNGDVWIWWNDATPAEQECFMLKYPESPFFKQ